MFEDLNSGHLRLPRKISEEEIERQLAEVIFEEFQKARSDGSHSMFRKQNLEKKIGRANKFRETIQVPKKVICEPRFEDPCGTLTLKAEIRTKTLVKESHDLKASGKLESFVKKKGKKECCKGS